MTQVQNLVRFTRGDSGRRLVVCLSVALVLAVMTGPDGNGKEPFKGISGSLFDTRVLGYLVFGVLLWLLINAWPRIRGEVTARTSGVRTSTHEQFRAHPWARYVLMLIVLVIAIGYPRTLESRWLTVLTTQIGIFILLTIGLNIVVGFAGLLDLGYIAFYAIGAYTVAYFTHGPAVNGKILYPLPVHAPVNLNLFLVIPIAVLVCVIAGVILGGPTLRLRGDYLAIVTLGFGEIVHIVAVNSDPITNGPRGAFGIPTPSLFGYHFDGLLAYWYLELAIIVLVVFLVRRLENSRVGRAWTAIREDEVAAAASGIATVRFKLLAFALGASTSGFAGVLYAGQVGFISPDNFILLNSILVLVYVIFGGMGSLPGAVIGAALLVWLPEYLKDPLPVIGFSIPPADRYIYFGALLVVMMIFRPQGVIPSKRRAREIKMAESGLGGADGTGVAEGTLAQ